MISVVVTGPKTSEDATGSNPAEVAGLNNPTLTTGMAISQTFMHTFTFLTILQMKIHMHEQNFFRCPMKMYMHKPLKRHCFTENSHALMYQCPPSCRCGTGTSQTIQKNTCMTPIQRSTQ